MNLGFLLFLLNLHDYKKLAHELFNIVFILYYSILF